MTLRYPLTIYYDSACPICTSEMTMLTRLDVDGHLRLVDCANGALDDASRAAGLMPADLLARIHARDADGRWLVGVDVFAAAYDAAGLALMARVFTIAWLRPAMDRAYPWVARNRYRLSRLGLQRLFRLVPHRAIRRAADRSVGTRGACTSGRCRP